MRSSEKKGFKLQSRWRSRDAAPRGSSSMSTNLTQDKEPHTASRSPFDLAWLALILGLVSWFLAFDPPPYRVTSDAKIEQMNLSAFFGVVSAVGFGLALRSVRVEPRSGLVWIAMLLNAGFVG